ncbi:MAG TPA: energy transducer TonB [Steroidobacteraceae bacterium]|jgi:TPR repeat protein
MRVGTPKISVRLRALLLIIVAAALMPVARADLYSASSEYQKKDYPHAFADFLALAELGQPQAQLNVAVMYRAGQGVATSDIHAYAWATLAAANGRQEARKLLDDIRPRLAPGSERIAGWITASYTAAALSQSLMPVARLATQEAAAQQRQWMKQCSPVSLYRWVYPEEARQEGMQGNVFVAFTLMPDGRARIPRVILGVPRDVFATATRESILHDGFAPLPPGSAPVHCVSFYRFILSPGGPTLYDYPRLKAYVDDTQRRASAGDPQAQLMYGMLLAGLPQLRLSGAAGLPWFLRAAQAGLPPAQFEVGYGLLRGIGCQPDTAKALEWLHMAADQNEPNAEVTLAMGAIRGSPGFGDMAWAKGWLERAAAQNNHDGELYLSALLAATADPRVRDPQRALELLQKAFQDINDDPTPFEIRAAAQAAEGQFADAVKSEQKAISRAHALRWDVSPLEARLTVYRSGKPWYGELLDY